MYTVCLMKIRSKHSSKKLLLLLRIFMRQMLFLHSIYELWGYLLPAPPPAALALIILYLVLYCVMYKKWLTNAKCKYVPKGQLISKANQSSRGFSQKTNENTLHSSKNEFICSFFGRILGLTVCFRNKLTFRCLLE